MAEKKSVGEGMGISGFTLGVISIIVMGWLGIITSIVGFIFCMIQQKKNPTRLGKAGIIINIISFILSVVFLIVYVYYLFPLIQQVGASPGA